MLVPYFTQLPPQSSSGWGFESPAQPLIRRVANRSGAVLVRGDDGTEATEIKFVADGWPIQPWQSPHPSRERRAGSIMRGDDGAEAKFSAFIPLIDRLDPLVFDDPIFRRGGGLTHGDDAIAILIAPPSTFAFLDSWPLVDRHQMPRLLTAGDDVLSVFVATPTALFDLWDIWDAVRRFPLRLTVSVDDVLTQFPTVPWWGGDSPHQPGHPLPERRSAAITHGDDGAEAVFINWAVMGFEIQPPQPQHPIPERRAAATMRGNDATEIKLTTPLWWETQINHLFAPQNWPWHRASGIQHGDDGGYDFTFAQFFPEGWEIQSWQPPHPVREKRFGGLARGDDQGIDYVLLSWLPDGWAIQSWQPPAATTWPHVRAGALMRGDLDGIDAIYQPVQPFLLDGWEIQPVQPPAPIVRANLRAGGIMVGDIGAWDRLHGFFPYGWAVQPPQPPHPSPERRAAAIMAADFGAYARLLQFVPMGWEVQPPQPPHPIPERRAAGVMRGDDGTEQVVLRIFQFDGWEVQPWQPVFRPPTRSAGGLFGGDAGLPPGVIIAQPIIFGWEIGAPQLRYRWRDTGVAAINPVSTVPAAIPRPWVDVPAALARQRRRGVVEQPGVLAPFPGALWGWEPAWPLARRRRGMLGLIELVSSFPARWTSGWDVAAWQPPRFGRARAAAWMRGDDGTQADLIVPMFDGWMPGLFWPPHPRPERAAAWMAGDIGGAWGPFVYLVPSGATVDDFPVWVAGAFDIGLPPRYEAEPE